MERPNSNRFTGAQIARTLIIAEAGVNHNGDPELARRLIDAAADASADVVKFQTFSADRLVTKGALKADYQARMTGPGESQYAMLKRLELTREMHQQMMAQCRSRGIEFFSTAFDLDSIDLLMELGFARLKVPSGEITNLPYLRRVGSYRVPVILSTGMATIGEVRAALGALTKAGTPSDQITILHCTTEYPTPVADVNLRAMAALRERFGTPVGYSDHTLGFEIAVAAVALGAVVIEKHFTLDRTLAGPDHKASLEPGELKQMITAIRNVEQAMGSGSKRAAQSEIKNKAITRKSIVAACRIRAGETFTEANVTVKRPGTGLSPMRWDEVIGGSASRDFAADELIEL